MTKQEFQIIATRLEAGWPGEFSPHTSAEYWDAIKGHGYDETMASLDLLRTTHEFRPTIAAMCKTRNRARNLSPHSALPGRSAPALTEGHVSPERAQELSAELVRRLGASTKMPAPAHNDGMQAGRLAQMRKEHPARFAAAMEASRTTELSFQEAWDIGRMIADDPGKVGLS